MSENSFELYNPFSIKAKILKRLYSTLFSNFNKISIKFLTKKTKEKSNFIKHLEKKLQVSIVSSLYFSTARDKIVIQLTSNNNTIAYAKVALNDLGHNHILNEIEAIKTLSKKNIVIPVLDFGYFQGSLFMLTENLKGTIQFVDKRGIISILNRLRKDKKHQLSCHPRILQIKEMSERNDMLRLSNILNEVVVSSKEYYFEAMEHGDFTPWNIISLKNKFVPFDFEYFENNGLEFLDFIKYYFQYGRLIKKFGKKKLLLYVSKMTELVEFEILMTIFLIKEIIIRNEEKQSFNFELQMLELIHDGKK